MCIKDYINNILLNNTDEPSMNIKSGSTFQRMY
jgi:hypothetical protein